MFGLNKGGAAAPMGGGAPMASPRPMQRPAMGAQPQAAAQPAPQRPGMFPNMSSQQRYDMTMELLKSGMSAAAQSNSPIAAFLAPLAGAAIGGSATTKREAAIAQEQDALSSALMPGGMSPRAEQLIDMLENENLPKAMRAVANAQLKDELESAMTPAKGGGGGKRSGGSGGVSKGGSKTSVNIYGQIVGDDGIVRGTGKDGTARPYLDENGQPLRRKLKPTDASAEDPLNINTGSGTEDPLGIR